MIRVVVAQSKPFYRRWWFIVLASLSVLGIIGSFFPESSSETDSNASVTSTTMSDGPTELTVRTTTSTTTTTTTTLPPYTDEEYAAALNRMSIIKDDVVGNRFVKAESSPDYVNEAAFYIYLSGTRTSLGTLRFVARYAGSDWVFFDEIIINVDGVVFRLEFEYLEVERDNGYSGVWEWIDINPTDEDILMLALIAGSKSTVVRFQGDTSKSDRNLLPKEKEAISDVLTVFDGYKRGKLTWQ
jgi:hypothetical protein